MHESDNTFLPEQVDEQIEYLSTTPLLPVQRRTPEQRLVQELQETYGAGQETTQAVEHVWQRLEHSHSHLMTHHFSTESPAALQHMGFTQKGRMTSVEKRQKRTLWQIVGTLVAALLVAVLAGSMLIITSAAHPPTTSKKHTPTPVSTTKPIIPATPYLYTARGRNLYKLDLVTGQVLWSYQTKEIASQPSYMNNIGELVKLNNTIYFSQGGQKIYAVNASDGHLLWNYMLPDKVTVDTLFLDEQTLYLTNYGDPNTSAGNTCVINPVNGHLLKCIPLLALAIHQGIIYGFSGPSPEVGRITLYAFNMQTNQQLWQAPVPIPHELFEELAYNNGVLYATSEIINKAYRLPSTHSYVSAFDAQTGRFLWHSSQEAKDYITNLVASNGAVYYGSQDGNSYAVSATNGQLLWKKFITYEVTVESYVPNANGVLFMGVSAYSGYPSIEYLAALNATNSQQIWKHPLPNYGGAPVWLINGILYTSTHDGKIHALKGSNGAEIWQTPVNSSSSAGMILFWQPLIIA